MSISENQTDTAREPKPVTLPVASSRQSESLINYKKPESRWTVSKTPGGKIKIEESKQKSYVRLPSKTDTSSFFLTAFIPIFINIVFGIS